AGRPEAQQIALRGVDDRLVDRTPELAQIAQRTDRMLDKTSEALWRGRVQPAALGLQPARVSEVVQRDHRGDPPVAERLEHLAVAPDRGDIEDALARLDPAPLDRHPVGVLAERRRAVEIGL